MFLPTILFIFYACMSTNACSPATVTAKPLSDSENCTSDHNCDPGSFCFSGTKSNSPFLKGICAPCSNCTKYRRVGRGLDCAKTQQECGPCIEGFEEVGGLCKKVAKASSWSYNNGSSSASDHNFFGTNILGIIGICSTIIIVLPLCIGLIYKHRDRFKSQRRMQMDPSDEDNLFELSSNCGSGAGGEDNLNKRQQRPSSSMVVVSAPPEEYEQPPPYHSPTFSVRNPASLKVFQLPQHQQPHHPFRSRHNATLVDIAPVSDTLQRANPFQLGTSSDWATETTQDFNSILNGEGIAEEGQGVISVQGQVQEGPAMPVESVPLNCPPPPPGQGPSSNPPPPGPPPEDDELDTGEASEMPLDEISFNLMSPPPSNAHSPQGQVLTAAPVPVPMINENDLFFLLEYNVHILGRIGNNALEEDGEDQEAPDEQPIIVENHNDFMEFIEEGAVGAAGGGNSMTRHSSDSGMVMPEGDEDTSFFD